MNNLTLCSLLHVNHAAKNNAVNINANFKSQAIDIYIKCADYLFRTLSSAGVQFIVVTNDVDYIKSRSSELKCNFEVACIDFVLDVPVDIPFHSAHHKIDIFSAFANGVFGRYVGLIDLDIVCLQPLLFNDLKFDFDKIYVYDITSSETNSYGFDSIEKSFKLLGISKQRYSWFGGELIIGSKYAFAKLVASIGPVWPLYLKNWKSLVHKGDEMIVSAALNSSDLCDLIVDVGCISSISHIPVVTRWWSTPTLSKIISLKAASNSMLLHLPADKKFIARCRDENISNSDFIRIYSLYIWRGRFLQIIKIFVNRIFYRRVTYLPNL